MLSVLYLLLYHRGFAASGVFSTPLEREKLIITFENSTDLLPFNLAAGTVKIFNHMLSICD